MRRLVQLVFTSKYHWRCVTRPNWRPSRHMKTS